MLAAKTNGMGLKYPMLCSPKLDGVRCLIIEGRALSRTFKPIPNHRVQFLFGRPELNGLDGELVVGDPTSKTAFRDTMSGVMSEEGKPLVTFHVFDDFSQIAQGWAFSARLNSVFKRSTLPHVKYVTHITVNTEDQLLRYEEQCLTRGYEGVMLRHPSGPYKEGRSTAREGFLLKLKRFEDSEAEVLGFEELMHNANEKKLGTGGKMERSHKKAGMIGQGKLGALQVQDLKSGVEFDLGTGFTAEERTKLWAKRTWLAGLIVKYKFFPTGSKDKPRFPTFLGFRDPIDL
jgi:DNA ligase-1